MLLLAGIQNKKQRILRFCGLAHSRQFSGCSIAELQYFLLKYFLTYFSESGDVNAGRCCQPNNNRVSNPDFICDTIP
jgi:hypothetical protein